jgi:hypothetical protein
MNDVLVGLAAIAIGLLFCFRGYVAMRLIIPVWAFFAGFMLGAGLVAGVGDEGFLQSAAAWLTGLAIGLLFAAIAYLYFVVSIVLAMGTVGFALGTAALTALDVTWSWVVVLGGLAAGVLLAVVAIATDLPAVVLIVLTAFGGASVAVFGLMLILGVVQTGELDSEAATRTADDDWWWYAIFLVLAVGGVVVQSRIAASLRASARDLWWSGPPPARGLAS